MRVYVPATSRVLRRLVEHASLGPAPMTGFAVTPGLREHYTDDDIEELEYAASAQAARASLRLIDSDPEAARRRVVISADVDSESVTVLDDLDIGAVRIQVEIPIAACAAVHVDDDDAEAVVAVAAQHVDAADLGDPAAEERVDDAEGYELAWYATQELQQLLLDLG